MVVILHLTRTIKGRRREYTTDVCVWDGWGTDGPARPFCDVQIFEDGTAPELQGILETRACNSWTFCHDEQGCGNGVVHRECTLKFSSQAYNLQQFGPVPPIGSSNDPRFHSGIVDREEPVGDPKCNAFTYRLYDVSNKAARSTSRGGNSR